MSIDPVTLPAWLYTAGTPAAAATATTAATAGTAATYAGLTASGWGTVATVAGTGLSAVSTISTGLANKANLKAQANQAEAEARYNAQLIDIKEKRDEKLLDNQFERQQAQRNTWFGKYGGGESALEVLAGAADSHEQDVGSLLYTAELDKASGYYTADAKALLARNRAKSVMSQVPMNTAETLLSGGAKAYRIYKGI